MPHRLAALLIALLAPAKALWAAEPAPTVPAALQVPAGAELSFSSKITGVQIYACAKKGDAAYEWQFKAPEGIMADNKGAAIGQHAVGPSWTLNDGSKITGEVLARAPAPEAADVPWLLLKTKSVGGAGRLAGITYVQRLKTQGGIAPKDGCDAGHLGAEQRSPYNAQYYFYTERS